MRKVREQLEEERLKEVEEYFKNQNNGKKLSEDEYEVVEDEYIYKCEICDRKFKSNNQFINHEKSKQHKQAVKNLQKEVMLKE